MGTHNATLVVGYVYGGNSLGGVWRIFEGFLKRLDWFFLWVCESGVSDIYGIGDILNV